MRLRQSDRQLLVEHVQRVGNGRTTILVAGLEAWDIKTQSVTPLHAHVYLESTESDATIRKRIKSLGYSTGVDYYLKKVDRSEDNYKYMCKGHKLGEYDVLHLDEVEARKHHLAYWETHEEIERRKESASGRVPIYFQIADYIQSNVHLFERHAYLLQGGLIVSVDDYDRDRDGDYLEVRRYLDERKAVDYIVEQYSRSGPLFDHDTIRKCLWLIVGRLDKKAAVDKALKLVGSFSAEL